MTETYKAYVVAISDTNYTILSERDKSYHVIPLPITEGNVRLSDGSIVFVSEVKFNPARLFAACRDYEYNLKRKREQYHRRKERRAEFIEPLLHAVSVPLVSPFTLN